MNIKGQGTKTYQLYVVPIGNAKITENIQFHPEATVLKYHQKSSNSCCLIILASYFHSIGYKRSVSAPKNLIEEILKLQINIFKNIIDFANDIMKNKLRHIGEEHLRYNLKNVKIRVILIS